jgi:hypothetical protein
MKSIYFTAIAVFAASAACAKVTDNSAFLQAGSPAQETNSAIIKAHLRTATKLIVTTSYNAYGDGKSLEKRTLVSDRSYISSLIDAIPDDVVLTLTDTSPSISGGTCIEFPDQECWLFFVKDYMRFGFKHHVDAHIVYKCQQGQDFTKLFAIAKGPL